MVSKWAVCILLECGLVLKDFFTKTNCNVQWHFQQESIPVGCVPPSSVVLWDRLSRGVGRLSQGYGISKGEGYPFGIPYPLEGT